MDGRFTTIARSTGSNSGTGMAAEMNHQSPFPLHKAATANPAPPCTPRDIDCAAWLDSDPHWQKRPKGTDL